MESFTSERRREVCIHEAAHAAIYSVASIRVARLTVAPADCTEWVEGAQMSEIECDRWGICQVASGLYGSCVSWDDDELAYVVKKIGMLQLITNGTGKLNSSRKQEIKGQICGILAGPVADMIIDTDYDALAQSDTPHSDIDKAMGLSKLLGRRHEAVYDHLITVTLSTLKTARVWDAVLRISDALERTGNLEGDELSALLPAPLVGWPPSESARKLKAA